MWLSQIRIKNIRAFEDENILFSKGITLLIGANNAGKSSILLPILSLQHELAFLESSDVRIGASEANATITFEETDPTILPNHFSNKISLVKKPEESSFRIMGITSKQGAQRETGMERFSASEPNNLFYPFVSKRKVTNYDEQVNQATSEHVHATVKNLNAKIDRLSNPGFLPAHDIYIRACREILGFEVFTSFTDHGKRAVYTVRNTKSIPLLSMGEGVSNILGLLVHMAIAEKRIFLIEEPENDVHPKALKGLLDVIAERSSENQFIITTHSNLVLKRLGAIRDSKIFEVTNTFLDRLPSAKVNAIETSDDRRKVLESLGYEQFDSELWDGWIFFEESSAEKIARQYLIPWFVPSLLSKVRTFSAHSISEISPKFRDFNQLFVFLHLEPVYKNRAWVIVDGGETEKGVVDSLKRTYCPSGWQEEHFLQLSLHNFEEYYPTRFQRKFQSIVTESDKEIRRAKKKSLLEEVELWIRSEPDIAKKEFESSAEELIKLFRQIEKKLKN